MRLVKIGRRKSFTTVSTWPRLESPPPSAMWWYQSSEKKPQYSGCSHHYSDTAIWSVPRYKWRI